MLFLTKSLPKGIEPMNKFFLISLSAAIFAFYGCGDDSSSSVNPQPESSSSSQEESSSSEVAIKTGPTIKDRGNLKAIKNYPVAKYKNIQESGAAGFAAAYWDACRPNCSDPELFKKFGANPYKDSYGASKSCSVHSYEIPAFTLAKGSTSGTYSAVPNACGYKTPSQGAFTCTDRAPVAVNDTLAYGFAAGYSEKELLCGRCFHIQFTGESEYMETSTTQSIKGKHMIVMVLAQGSDGQSTQVDLMIPGSGNGAYDVLPQMVPNDNTKWGEPYGGFAAECYNKLGYESSKPEEIQECIREKCQVAFDGEDNLLEGCLWSANWFYGANMPKHKLEEVECPQYLVDKYMSTINTEADNNFKYQSDWSIYNPGDFVETVE